MHTAVVTAKLQATMTEADATDKINVGEEALDTHEVAMRIAMIQVLAWNKDVVELEEAELAEVVAIAFEVHVAWAAVETFLEAVPPFSQLLDVLVHRGLLVHKVGFERFANVRGKYGFSESGDVGFGLRWELDVLSIESGLTTDVG
jgi:hypothetical protein